MARERAGMNNVLGSAHAGLGRQDEEPDPAASEPGSLDEAAELIAKLRDELAKERRSFAISAKVRDRARPQPSPEPGDQELVRVLTERSALQGELIRELQGSILTRSEMVLSVSGLYRSALSAVLSADGACDDLEARASGQAERWGLDWPTGPQAPTAGSDEG
jgi:hypothetical protein